jgi:hypothetical protein
MSDFNNHTQHTSRSTRARARAHTHTHTHTDELHSKKRQLYAHLTQLCFISAGLKRQLYWRVFRPEDGDDVFLRNAGICLRVYVASKFRTS